MATSKKVILYPLIATLVTACSSAPLERRPAVLYKEGEELFASQRYEDAIAQWKRVREAYASPELSTNAELKIADAYYESEKFIEATAAYEEFRKLHPAHEQAPYALYRMGLSSFNQITGIDTDQTPQKNAEIYFEDFLRQHPKSEYAAEVKEKLGTVVQQRLQHELYVARFYYRTEKFSAAIKRLEEALVAYPNNSLHDETLFLLGASRLRNGDLPKARDAFNRLSSEFPSSRYIVDASKLLEKYY